MQGLDWHLLLWRLESGECKPRSWKHFDAQASDLEDLCWTKDNCYILAWENSLAFRLNIYNPVNGLYREYVPQEQPVLGIRTFSLSPNGTYTAAGGYNSDLKIFSTLTWEIVTELKHEKDVPSKALVYKEEMYKEGGAEGGYASKYTMLEGDVKLQAVKNPSSVAMSLGKEKSGVGLNIGVSQAIWSHNSSFLATKHGEWNVRDRVVSKCSVGVGHAHDANNGGTAAAGPDQVDGLVAPLLASLLQHRELAAADLVARRSFSV